MGISSVGMTSIGWGRWSLENRDGGAWKMGTVELGKWKRWGLENADVRASTLQLARPAKWKLMKNKLRLSLESRSGSEIWRSEKSIMNLENRSHPAARPEKSRLRIAAANRSMKASIAIEGNTRRGGSETAERWKVAKAKARAKCFKMDDDHRKSYWNGWYFGVPHFRKPLNWGVVFCGVENTGRQYRGCFFT